MGDKRVQKIFLRLVILFIIINSASFALDKWLDAKNINHVVLMSANALLFFLSVLSILMYSKAVQKPNPQVFVRTIMAATFIKLMVIAFATILYFLTAGNNKSVYAIVISMGLYIFYTIIEVKGAFRINKAGNG